MCYYVPHVLDQHLYSLAILNDATNFIWLGNSIWMTMNAYKSAMHLELVAAPFIQTIQDFAKTEISSAYDIYNSLASIAWVVRYFIVERSHAPLSRK